MEENLPKKDIFFAKKENNLIAICSGSYGTGKTWFATNFAHALSQNKRKILFFDGDWSSNNIQSLIELKPKYTLGDTIYKQQTINQTVTPCEKFGFDVLCGSSEVAGLSTLPIGRLQLLSEDLILMSKFYDNVVLDINSGDLKSAKILAGTAKRVILIVTPDPKSLVQGYNFIRLMYEQYPACKLQIVINQVNSKREGEMIYNTLLKTTQKFLEIQPELLGIICIDTRIKDCQRNQTLLLSRYPTSDTAADLMNMVKQTA